MRIQSAAKINLVLNVLGKRTDGYHDLRMVMQSVSLYDFLDFTPADILEIAVPPGITGDPRQNLVWRAAELFLVHYAPARGVKITLHKNIPLAAGLAGGSTDCAGTLFGLNKFFQLNRPLAELEALAAQLGSDTVYCLHGGTRLAEGRGERLTVLPELPCLHGLLLKPPFGLSTAEVYQRFTGSAPVDIQAYRTGRLTVAELAACTANDLTAAARQMQPALEDYFRLVASTHPAVWQMSGSGPAIFAFYADKTARNTALLALQEHNEVYPVETVTAAQTITEK